MAKETLTRVTCDRCNKMFNESAPLSAQFEKAPPTLHLEFTPGEDPKQRLSVSFSDLCPKCQGRISDLVGQIKLDRKDGDSGLDPTGKTSDNKTPAEPPPAAATK